MTTSPKMSMKSVISREDIRLTPAQLGYLNSRLQAKAHGAVVELYTTLAREEGMSRAFIARRLGKKPEQITRWLAAPGNWTLETLSNLLSAMGYEPTIGIQPLDGLRVKNFVHPAAYSPQPQVRSPIYRSSNVEIEIDGDDVTSVPMRPINASSGMGHATPD